MIGTKLGIYSQVTATPFYFGNALITDGTDDYVSFAPITELSGASKFSLHYWTEVDSVKFSTFGSNSTAKERFSISKANDSNLYFIASNGSIGLGSTSYSSFSGQKVLISMVFDGTLSGNSNRLKGYVNSVQQTLSFTGTIQSTISSNQVVSDEFFVNRVEIISQFGDAKYNELAMVNGASTLSEIQAFYNNGDGNFAADSFSNLLSNWKCNEANGATTLVDELGNYNGTLNNFTTPPAYFAPF